jgi:hypothetical protein
MNPWIQLAVLVAPFALLGALVAFAIVVIGNGTRPHGPSRHQVTTPRATAAPAPASHRAPVTSSQGVGRAVTHLE